MEHRTRRGRSRIPASIAALSALAVTVTGCSDFLDVNENPNAPEHARVELTLPAVIATFGHSVLAAAPTEWGAEWMQQLSYNRETRSYSEIHRYELSALNADYPWTWIYAELINETHNIQEETDPAVDGAYHGIAKFLQAWAFSYLTDAWGPIPFSQALDTRNAEPVYDEQREVYIGVHRMLDEAIEEMQRPSARVPGVNDLLFEGDMDRWVELAHMVQARLHLRLTHAPGENAATRAQAALDALQGGFTSNADDADFTYPGGEPGWRQPFWVYQNITGFAASQHFVELLRGLDDPRLPIAVQPVLDSLPKIVYIGHRNGAGEERDSSVSEVGAYFTAEDRPLTWFSYAEGKFIEAEARLIVAGAAAADVPYRAGIRANMEKMGVAPGEIDAYLAARPPLTQVANALEEIMEQKYIADYLSIEAWNDWRRTGYPQLALVDGAMLPGIPQRIRMPASELASNAASVAATGIPQGLEGMMTKVWWASQGPQ